MTFKFHAPNLDALAKLAEQTEEEQKNRGNFDDGIRWLNLDIGRNCFVVCPPYNSRGLYVRKEFTHWFSKEAKVVCPEITEPRDHKCPICEVIRALSMQPDIDTEDLKNFNSRGRTFVNVLPIEVGDKELDFSSGEHQWLPHILSAPSSLGDFINTGWPDYPNFANPDEAIKISVKKIKTGKRPQDVKYEISWTPDRMSIYEDDGQLAQIGESMYDLDRIIGRWTPEKYIESVKLANSLLAKFNYETWTDDDFAERCPPPTGKKEDGDSEEVNEDEEPKRKIAAPPSKKATPPSSKKTVAPPVKRASVPKATRPESVVAKASGQQLLTKAAEKKADNIVREPKLDDSPGNPKCFGNQNHEDPVCGECKALTPCVIESVNRLASKSE